MSITYNASTNFGAKDALPVNDPDKVIYGAEFTAEFNAITSAFGNAAPTASPTFTGTATFSDVDINGSTVTIGTESISDTLIAGWNTTKSTVDAGAAGWDSTKSTVDAGATNWDTAYGWGDHSLAGYTTTDTTYSAGTNISLSGTTFNLDASLTGLTDVTTDAVSIGLWEIKLDTNDLRFVYDGTDVLRVTTAGAVIALDDVTAFGAP